MVVIVLIRYAGNVIDDKFDFAILLNGYVNHAGVLSVALFIFQRQPYSPGIDPLLFRFVRTVLPGRQRQIPVVIVTFGDRLFFDDWHNQRTRGVVFRLPGCSYDFVVMANKRVDRPFAFLQPDGLFRGILNHTLRMRISCISFQP